jgi:hypothetical protein
MYPIDAGSKAKDQLSLENADRISRSARRDQVQAALLVLFFESEAGISSNHAAERMGERLDYVRPRVSELRTLGLIDVWGRSYDSITNIKSNTWRLTREAEAAMERNIRSCGSPVMAAEKILLRAKAAYQSDLTRMARRPYVEDTIKKITRKIG